MPEKSWPNVYRNLLHTKWSRRLGETEHNIFEWIIRFLSHLSLGLCRVRDGTRVVRLPGLQARDKPKPNVPNAVCPRSLVHFYIASRYLEMDKTSWTGGWMEQVVDGPNTRNPDIWPRDVYTLLFCGFPHNLLHLFAVNMI